MTITDQIAALLSADPICNGRVTGETVRAIAEVASERAAIVAWLRAEAERIIGDNPDLKFNVQAVGLCLAAGAIERGDFGAGEGEHGRSHGSHDSRRARQG